ncbi:YppE family protein [Bacillus methanolicus]|uniref:DUF1798 family protein n=1 Tax=Bacillus methanolicus (strain MGA3 / ATCC 53907) TaxID=796606 RepID=I3E9T7_BACMM|nr:YppE family protein [Bacillus methanolicus]AIE60505.1 hypothetical protein BMMGA3_10545 [Bacillus methanolicus MGA3]EIJ83258.1 hypothetical protein MGA3_08550 [Bacillus methanolicus MGA3]
MSEYKKLYDFTKDLLEAAVKAYARFEEIKESKTDADFYKEVKPFVDETAKLTDQWKKAAIDWITKEKPRNFHKKQIEDCSKNIEMISIQAFFSITSRKRFIDHFQSVRFLLTGLLMELESKK